MPRVTVKVSNGFMERQRSPDLHALIKGMQEVIASALSCIEARLIADEVEVEIEELGFAGSRSESDRDNDIMIIAEANDYPSRRMNLHERTLEISRWFHGQGLKGSIWVRLAPGSYQTF